MNLIINLVGVGLAVLVYWFFFMKKEGKGVAVEDEITIVVKGGFKPNIIRVKKGKPVTLKFDRKDKSSCLEEVVIPGLKIRKHLILNKVTKVRINPTKVGEYGFSCGMGMHRGKIKVEN